ncbi:MAG: Bax inhibitor-1/YccA family protein [Bifidobacteriaceae bacterium]|jgi:FtsH-binding integral membrane protein|nr:Bax inhibitor-1/YccA family protein [Bifidobacteriaceae bacterium]
MTYNDPFNSNAPRQNAYGAQQPAQSMGNPVLEAQPVRVSETTIRRSVSAAYGEMAIGLVVTAVVAALSASTGAVISFLQTVGQFGWYALLIAQVVLAVVLGARALKMNPATARVLFYVYAATMGFSLSTIFFVFDLGSIGVALGLTAAFFLCLTMIGLTTKVNILKAGPIFMVGLIVLIIAEVVLMFLNVSGMTMIVAGISLILFAGLTMYDAQSTRAMYQQLGTSDVMVKRISILAALNLYLDFINMFMSLLQLFGSRN